MADVAVVDTHALVWYADEDWRRLGSAARELFERAEEGGFTRWAERLLASTTFLVADLTAEIVLHAETLYAISERTDRLIAATASVLDCPLITRDREITSVSGVEVIW